MVLSFTKRLPWSHCDNDFNTPDCLDPEWIYGDSGITQPNLCNGIAESENTTTKVLKQVCLNGTLRNLSDFTPAVEEFWERKILQQHLSTGIDNLGGINWELALSLIVLWIVIYFIIYKGVKSSGKVVYFTIPFSYILLTILLVRALTLENAFEGLNFYLNPDLGRLSDGQVWLDAATQIFFSYSIGLGTLMALGSYNKFNHNFFRDGLVFTLVNSGTSIYAGLVIFSVLGFMAGQQGVTVADVAKGGPGLAFVAYPEAVAQMPIPHLWAVLFFLMVLLRGLDAEFHGVEGFIIAVVDTWPHIFRKGYRREMFAAFYCFISCCAGLTMTSYGGIYIFQLFDTYSASGPALLWISAFESGAIAWFYGGNRFIRNFNEMLEFREGCCGPVWKLIEFYFQACWYLLTPLICLGVFIFNFIGYENLVRYHGYVYPWWGYLVGWFLALSSMLTVLLYFLYAFLAAEGMLSDRWEALITPRLPNRDTEGEVMEDMVPRK
ncbi:sodium- and chloride-dependent creatine transporter 1-like [Amphiura filiformis]|uniref:sodium- and chloride-dependent creatine transporter 1-like n=1 Tax=Amphiura filiformis TaxID=82378 RepID=UPI003B21C22C